MSSSAPQPTVPLMLLPMVAGKVPCGFPSPADDFLVKRLDLNDLLITHPQVTFFWQASGDSMREAGIFNDDILVVNRALSPRHGHIVVAQVDSDFTVKRLFKRAGRVRLEPANPTFPVITFKDDQQLIVCGVVIASIKRYVHG
ncbi:MAG: peptidase [Variovorax paradoxus]|nr:MAG: peptidase [Variovorax paradoxus]PZQ00065.1 MAG: peptidase [Variovorax paradoxus]